MKLRILAAASALAIAGAAFAVYRETRPDTVTDAAGTPTPVERAASSTSPASTDPASTEATASPPAPMSAARTSAPPAPALPVPAAVDSHAATSSLSRPSPSSTAVTRRSVTSIKQSERGSSQPVPSVGSEAAIVRQKRMNRTLESAACHAPDLEQRYRKLPETERAALRARCAKYGVTLTDPS